MASELLVFLVTTAIVSHARGLTIEEVEPSYGPLAGGTVVTITLSHTEELKLDGVLMGSHSCFIDSRVEHVTSSVHHVSVTCTAPNITCTRVTCTTSGVVGVREDTVTNVTVMTSRNVTQTDANVMTLRNVTQTDANVMTLRDVTLTNVTFTYKQNPNVTGISRSKSFKSGGLPVYLEGHHLTHAHSAVLSTVPLNNDDQPIPADFHHSQDCVILSDTRLECVTPNLGVLWTALGLHALPDHVSPRLNTRLVISLDGYRDVIHGFTITEDPTLDEWHHQGAKSYDPEREVLHIGGQRLLQGAEAGDYRVEVGVAGCRVSRVVDNNIWCTPPESQPRPNANISINTPTVVVVVGSLRLSLGELVYRSSGDGAAPQVALGVVGGSAAVLVVVVTVIAYLVYKRKSKVRKVREAMAGFENPGGPRENQYSRNGPGQDEHGYLQPTVTLGLPGSYPGQTGSSPGQTGSYPGQTGSSPGHPATSPPQDVTPSRRPSQLDPSLPDPSAPPPQKKPSLLGRLSLVSIGSNSPLKYFRTNRSQSVSTVGSSTLEPGGVVGGVGGTGGGVMVENAAYALPRHSIPMDILAHISVDLAYAVTECLVDPERVRLGGVVGRGFFGSVLKGELVDESGENSTTVAVKTVQGKHCTMKDVTSFLEEAVVMKDFNHPNVLSLVGVAVRDNKQPFVILPFMEHGDLKSYISNPDRKVTVRELSSFGVQIAAGMDYLSQQKFVHRDLATRNCMINKSLIVKIADFGLSRDIYKSDYYRVEDKKRPLPVKWMALESLTEGVFSSKTDVWSFGVVLWELMTRGCGPYPDIDSFNMKGYLNSGRRLSQPEHAPDQVYALMCSCWKEKPEDRPSFSEIYSSLKDIVNERETSLPDYLVLL